MRLLFAVFLVFFTARFFGGALASFFAAFLDFFFFEDFLATTKSFWSAQT